MGRKLLTAGLVVAALILVLGVAAELYWSSKYVDETITTGEKWGIRIGETPQEALERLQVQLGDWDAKVVVFTESDPKGDHLGSLSTVQASQLEDANRVVVFWNGDAVSDLLLRFDKGRLTSAHMKQRAFELP